RRLTLSAPLSTPPATESTVTCIEYTWSHLNLSSLLKDPSQFIPTDNISCISAKYLTLG
ncbi:hypothetical protein COCMIDRAFT_96864, partial [Bipolaris oryzae ATCC 44560]